MKRINEVRNKDIILLRYFGNLSYFNGSPQDLWVVTNICGDLFLVAGKVAKIIYNIKNEV